MRQATQTQPALLLAADAPFATAPLQARKIMSIRRDHTPRIHTGYKRNTRGREQREAETERERERERGKEGHPWETR